MGTPPEGTRLVSCCPGLQSFACMGLQYSAEQLAPLQGLTALHTLTIRGPDGSSGEEVGVVGQLTGLQKLTLHVQETPGGLLRLTRLQRLTQLNYWGRQYAGDPDPNLRCFRQVGSVAVSRPCHCPVSLFTVVEVLSTLGLTFKYVIIAIPVLAACMYFCDCHGAVSRPLLARTATASDWLA
jgi:hypothetical protein